MRQIVVDCSNPSALADFWAGVTGASVTVRSSSWATVHATPALCFQRVPEKRSAKNRVHIDWTVENIEEHAAVALALGATQLADFCDAQGRCVVMADPEGNEYCLTASATDDESGR